jgi:hypothetical protein
MRHLKAQKKVKLAVNWVATAQGDAIKKNIMPFIQTSFAQSQSASSKTTTVCVQYVAVSCCLSAKQMATSKQCKVPIMMMCVLLPLEKNLVWSTLTGRKEPNSKRSSLSSEKYLIEVTSPKSRGFKRTTQTYLF